MVVITAVALAFASLTGCNSFRLAPSEPQKQAAYQALLDARTADSVGADPRSVLTGRLVQGTGAALSYAGMPKSPEIEDYSTTVAQAQADATRRPTAGDAFDAAEKGLSLAAELAILFGAGGIGVGGKKVIEWIALARQKSKALGEIVQGNELFMATNPASTDAFKSAQGGQSDGTQIAVAAARKASNFRRAPRSSPALQLPVNAGAIIENNTVTSSTSGQDAQA